MLDDTSLDYYRGNSPIINAITTDIDILSGNVTRLETIEIRKM